MRLSLALIGLANLTIVACQQTESNPPSVASLTGDVFVTMKSADVKRVADVDVLVLRATTEFDAALERVQAEYEEKAHPIVTQIEALEAPELRGPTPACATSVP